MDEMIAKNSLDCPINNHRIGQLEEGFINVKDDILEIRKQNNGQDNILTQIKAVVDFMIDDKKEQKEFNQKQIVALEEITKTQIETQSVLKSLTSDVDEIKEWQKGVDKRGKIDLVELFKDNIKYVIGTITVAGILYVISQIAPTLIK